MASLGKNIDVMLQVRRISRNLNRIVDVVTPAVRDTMLGQAALIASEMRRVVSVGTTGEHEIAGALRDSIRVEEGAPTAKKAIVIRIKAGGRKTINAGESHSYDYARANEFGTTEMHAKPFFYPVYRSRRKEAGRNIRARMKKEVVKVFGSD